MRSVLAELEVVVPVLPDVAEAAEVVAMVAPFLECI